MSFEDIRSIWDSQQAVDGLVDKESLIAAIKSKHSFFARIVGVTEIVMTMTLLFVAAMFMRDPLLQGHDRVLIIGGIASLAAASFIWTGRIARKKREVQFEDSLLGIVERSIHAVDYQSRRMRTFLWWFALPNALGLVIGLVIVDEAKRYLFYTVFIPAFVGCMALAYWQIRREVRQKLIPEKAQLEELRNKLLSG